MANGVGAAFIVPVNIRPVLSYEENFSWLRYASSMDITADRLKDQKDAKSSAAFVSGGSMPVLGLPEDTEKAGADCYRWKSQCGAPGDSPSYNDSPMMLFPNIAHTVLYSAKEGGEVVKRNGLMCYPCFGIRSSVMMVCTVTLKEESSCLLNAM